MALAPSYMMVRPATTTHPNLCFSAHPTVPSYTCSQCVGMKRSPRTAARIPAGSTIVSSSSVTHSHRTERPVSGRFRSKTDETARTIRLSRDAQHVELNMNNDKPPIYTLRASKVPRRSAALKIRVSL